MSTQTGFGSIDGTPFVYLQDSNNASFSMGLDVAGSDVFKISVSTSAGALPTTSPQFLIDPAANGNITMTPNGLGKIVASYMGAGVVQSSSAGVLTSSNGTNGQVLIGGGAAPAWTTITAGSGITVTNGANSITIAASGSSVLETLTGNTGGAISPTAGNINIVTSNATVDFAGSGSTLTQDFGGGISQNLVLGTSLPSLTSGTNNTGVGFKSLLHLTSGTENTAFGDSALYQIGAVSFNSGFGLSALQNVTSGNGHNTAIGNGAGASMTSGAFNTLLGFESGNSYTSSESSNIVIGTGGTGIEGTGQSNTLLIGSATGSGNYQLSSAFICGIDGVNVGSVAKVVTMASGSTNQLGTATITAGSGITVTPSANTITIAVSGGGGGITTIDGNSGSATGSTVTITTGAANANGTALFTASGATVTQTFSDANNNTGLGLNALAIIGTGANSTALGWNAGPTATGDGLCLVGSQAGNSLTTGHHNTILGGAGMFSVVSGTWNVSVGASTCLNYGAAESSNIILNARTTPVANENNTLRIGDGTGSGDRQLAQSFISGIQGVVVTGTAVLVSASDQLGVAASSKRFKSDVQDMGVASSDIYRLRPVTFVWNKSSSPGLKDAPSDRQFGLIAEEVAQTMPHLVGLDKDGNPFNVHYERLIPMLLNEIQRLEKRVAALERK